MNKKETWIEIKIDFENFEDRYEILRSFVKPVIQTLYDDKIAETFHFFFEPHLLLRIRIRDNMKSKINPIIEDNLKHIEKIITNEDINTTYTGEQASYGEKGWEVAQKFFECGSRISLLMNDPTVPKEKEFHAGKFVHCFLNTLGYTYQQEAIFHHEKNIEKWLRAMGLL